MNFNCGINGFAYEGSLSAFPVARNVVMIEDDTSDEENSVEAMNVQASNDLTALERSLEHDLRNEPAQVANIACPTRSVGIDAELMLQNFQSHADVPSTSQGIGRDDKDNIDCTETGGVVSACDSDEEQVCPICFEDWTNAGSHRIASLQCGHLFGRSCIEKWLKDPKNKFCPQCKARAKAAHIRNIYAKSVRVRDNSAHERALKDLQNEKYRRSKAEEGEAKAVLQYQLLKAEMERLKQQLVEREMQASTSSSRPVDVCAAPASVAVASRLTGSAFVRQSSKTSHLELKKTFVHQKSIQISQAEARVMAYDPHSLMLVASKPSPNQLFPGFGVLKVSSLESRSSEYVRIHQKQIRDVKFNPSGDQLILTASVDKTLKLTSVNSNQIVQNYPCEAPVWSCCWNQSNSNYIYAGQQNGACSVYDIRKASAMLVSIRPRVGVPCPIVSLSYVPPGAEGDMFQPEGVLVGTLQGGWFLEKAEDQSFAEHQLLLPEGSCTSLLFEPKSRLCMLSQRPCKTSTKSVHTLLELAGSALVTPYQCNVVVQCFGGNMSKLLTRSTVFTTSDDQKTLLMGAGDEATQSILLWNAHNGGLIQRIPSTGGEVLDLLSFDACENQFLAALTDQKLSFYQWQ